MIVPHIEHVPPDGTVTQGTNLGRHFPSPMRKESRAVLRTFSPILAEHVLELLAVARQCCGSRFFNQKMPAVTSGGT